MYLRPEINYPSSLVKTKKRARDDSDEDVGPHNTQKKNKNCRIKKKDPLLSGPVMNI